MKLELETSLSQPNSDSKGPVTPSHHSLSVAFSNHQYIFMCWISFGSWVPLFVEQYPIFWLPISQYIGYSLTNDITQVQKNTRHQLRSRIYSTVFLNYFHISLCQVLYKSIQNDFLKFCPEDKNNCHNWLMVQNHRILLQKTLSLAQATSVSHNFTKHGTISSALFLAPTTLKESVLLFLTYQVLI